MKKRTIIIAILIFVMVISALFVFVVKKNKKEVVLKILSEKADLYVRDFHYTEVGDPESTWEINADSAKYVKKENLVFLENVRVKLITSDGRTFLMTGEEGRLNTDIKDISVKGNVVIFSDNGDRITTDYLNYSDSEKKVYTDSCVRMRTPRMKLKGVGLSISLKTKKLRLLSQVSAIISDFNLTR
jgi:LPS export ABC transporter protein LptC